MLSKRYIGDSVYAQVLHGTTVALTTDNGRGPTNKIILEPEVFEALAEYVTKAKEALNG